MEKLGNNFTVQLNFAFQVSSNQSGSCVLDCLTFDDMYVCLDTGN